MARRESFNPKHCHAEIFVIVACIFAAEFHEPRMGQPEFFAQRPEMLLDEIGAKAIMTGRYRGMRGEDNFARHARGSLLEAHPFFFHAAANCFEHGKSTVPLVEVQHARSNAHRAQRAHAANAEQKFLPDADAFITAVQARSQLAIFGHIPFYIRIEQQQIAAADADTPDFRLDITAAGIDPHHDLLAALADRGLHREKVHVGVQILFLLPAGLVQVLAEIALAIKQSDSDERNVEVGSALDVIAGEHAQAA